MFPVSPYVALEVIDDGMASEPKYLHPLVTHAMTALGDPSGGLGLHETRMLALAAGTSETIRGLIADELRAALGGTSAWRSRAKFVQGTILAIADTTQLRANVRELASVRRDLSRRLPDEPPADWRSFSETLDAYADRNTKDALEQTKILITNLRLGIEVTDEQLDELGSFLNDADNAYVLDEALEYVAEAEPHVMAVLRHELLPTIWRHPVDLHDGP